MVRLPETLAQQGHADGMLHSCAGTLDYPPALGQVLAPEASDATIVCDHVSNSRLHCEEPARNSARPYPFLGDGRDDVSSSGCMHPEGVGSDDFKQQRLAAAGFELKRLAVERG